MAVGYAVIMLMTHMNEGTWGISEIGMSMTLYALLYGILEVLFAVRKYVID